MAANVPDGLIIWAFNALISAVCVLGALYVRQIKSDLEKASDKVGKLAEAYMQLKVDVVKDFVLRSDADAGRKEIVDKLDYLTKRIDTLIAGKP